MVYRLRWDQCPCLDRLNAIVGHVDDTFLTLIRTFKRCLFTNLVLFTRFKIILSGSSMAVDSIIINRGQGQISSLVEYGRDQAKAAAIRLSASGSNPTMSTTKN